MNEDFLVRLLVIINASWFSNYIGFLLWKPTFYNNDIAVTNVIGFNLSPLTKITTLLFHSPASPIPIPIQTALLSPSSYPSKQPQFSPSNCQQPCFPHPHPNSPTHTTPVFPIPIETAPLPLSPLRCKYQWGFSAAGRKILGNRMLNISWGLLSQLLCPCYSKQ